ncbi:transglycosylase family protein [Demetria terragena]|uniref:transglycosylase family protein n=1 Tax=Demetria terragena TaxID=63959 RepID=UPI0003A3DF61|nr:transglycosylase family protein [Demetria terragena]
MKRRAAGVVVLSAATIGAGLATSGSAEAHDVRGVWDDVADCESGENWSINTGNGYYGGLQFSASTWSGFGGKTYGTTANKATRSEQIIIAKKVLEKQGPGAWPTCSKRAGLTRENGAAAHAHTGSDSDTGNSTPSAGKLAVDGSFGPLTVKGVQKWVGTTQDGSFGPGTKKALQRKVGVAQDGDIGPATVAALQTKVGISRDGAASLNSRTVRGLQTYLNANVL